MEQLNNKNQARQSYGYAEYPREFSVNFMPARHGTYIIEIDDVIEHVSQFSTAVHVLNNAKEEDDVEIRLSNCPGGLVDGADTLLHAISKTPAHVHCIATGGVHSMGSQILLAVDSFELSEGFNSLVHAGYSGAGGTISEYHTKSKFDLDFRTRQFKSAYQGFLTDAEVESVLAGTDIWLDGSAWMERAQKRREFFEAGVMKMIAEAEEAERIEQLALTSAPKPVAKKPLKLKPAKKPATDSTN